MNIEIFVQNVKKCCQTMGISPSKACSESGAGKTLLDNVKRGRAPSIDSVQLLAQYLGVTTSELLGESLPEEEIRATLTEHPAQPAKGRLEMPDYVRPREPGQGDLIFKFNSLSPDDQEEVLAIIEMKLARKSSRK